ncbi:ScbR family autoregulator-binding transcription factor [Thermomonospora amylolytica]|uniref:ScbR family autoregulator-binding transcription factor n=1 Tax=Thermomonospora amylolytica TaxID=1411117 RepID=UPI000E6B72B0|nr:ScbR family autoregulator-binding transcription factor [Thermomonospora amylolytica]
MQKRAERTRQAILMAAAEMFEAKGYQATSLQDIVTGRDVSKGAVYFHFPSKQNLAVAILQEQLGRWPALVDELRQHNQRVIRLLPELLWRAHAIFHDDVLTRASTRLACEGDLIGASAPHLFCGQADVIDALLQEAREQGDLRPDVDTRIVAELIVATFAGLQRMAVLHRTGNADVRAHLAEMWRWLLPGLVKAEHMNEVMRGIDGIGPMPDTGAPRPDLSN